MKIISDRMVKARRRVTVELDRDEVLMTIYPEQHYGLGEPLNGDVVPGHVIEQAEVVSWCPIEQKWIK